MSFSQKSSNKKDSIVGKQALIKENFSRKLHSSTDKVPQHDDEENDKENIRNAVYTAMKNAHCIREPLKRHIVHIKCCQHGERCGRAKYFPSKRDHELPPLPPPTEHLNPQQDVDLLVSYTLLKSSDIDSQNSDNDRSNVKSSAEISPIQPRNLGKFKLASSETKSSSQETDADNSMIKKIASFTAIPQPLEGSNAKVVDKKNTEKIEAAKKVDQFDDGAANQQKAQQRYKTFDPAHYYVGTCTKESAVKHLKEAYHFRFYHPKISRANANLEALEEKIPLHLIYRQTNDGEKIKEIVIRTRSTEKGVKEISLDGEKWFSSFRDLLKHYSKNSLPNE